MVGKRNVVRVLSGGGGRLEIERKRKLSQFPGKISIDINNRGIPLKEPKKRNHFNWCEVVGERLKSKQKGGSMKPYLYRGVRPKD